MNSKTEIANFALSQLGEGFSISNFDTDQSEEAFAVRSEWSALFEIKVMERRWQRFTQDVVLGLVACHPNPMWEFSYRYPAKCADFIRILNGDPWGDRLPVEAFKIGSDEKGLLVFTNRPHAWGSYIMSDPPLTLWTANFKVGFGYSLAALIAPRIMKDASSSTISRCTAEAEKNWYRAKFNDNREKQRRPQRIGRIQESRLGIGRNLYRRPNNW